MMPNTDSTTNGRTRNVLILSAAVGCLIAIAVAALLVNIFEKKQQARSPFTRVIAINDTTDDPALWGKDFPQEYDLYKKTTEQAPTKFGGSKSRPAHPDGNRSAHCRLPGTNRGRPAPEGDVGRLRLFGGLPQEARA